MRASSTAGQRRWRARSGLALATCAAAVAVTGCRRVARDTGGRTITNPTPVVVAPPVDAGRITDYFEIDDAGHPLFGARAPPSRPRPFREITLRFAPGGALILAGVPTTLAALPEAPAPYVTVHPEWVDVTLIASTKRPYAQVRDVLTVLRKAGLERVVLDATD